MVIIFENNSLLAQSLGVLYRKRGEALILPSSKASSMNMALTYLEGNVDDISLILINAYASFEDPPRIMAYEGLKILKEVLIEEKLDEASKILYSFDPFESLKAHGGKVLFDEGYEEIFQFVKLPGIFPA